MVGGAFTTFAFDLASSRNIFLGCPLTCFQERLINDVDKKKRIIDVLHSEGLHFEGLPESRQPILDLATQSLRFCILSYIPGGFQGLEQPILDLATQSLRVYTLRARILRGFQSLGQPILDLAT